MGPTRLLLLGSAAASAGAAALITARRVAGRPAAEAFYASPLERTEPGPLGSGYGGGPFFCHDVDAVDTFHGASFEAVRAALPSDELHPVRLPNGRAVVLVGAIQYGDITANGVDGLAMLPYAEVLVAAAVTRRPAPPFVPLVAPGSTGRAAGWFVLHFPVTTRVARDVGRILWGYPKFIADMEFDDSLAERRVHLSEGGHTILTHAARPSGHPSVSSDAFVAYSVVDGRLIETKLPTYGLRQSRWGGSGGRLELGDHQVADELRRLEVASEPFLTVLTSAQRAAMTVGRPIGPARPYLGYIGEDRDLGRYIVRFPGTAPIDRYAPFAPTAGPAETIATFAPAGELAEAPVTAPA